MKLFDRFFGPPGKHQFAKLVLRRLKGAGERRPIVYDRDEFRLLCAGENGFVANLGNVYSDFCAAKGPRRQLVLQHFVRSFFVAQEEMPDNFAGAKGDLFPSLRARSYFELLKLHQQAEGDEPVDTPLELLNDHLAVALVYDLPSAMRFITQKELDEWDVSFFEAMEAAKDNLRQKASEFAVLGNGLHVSHSDDGYTATRMLLSGLYEQLDIRGEPLAAIPNRDTLLIGGVECEADAIGMMAALTDSALGEGRPITGRFFRLTADEWLPWLPDRGHPHYQQLRVLELRSSMMDYEDQKHVLEKFHDKSHDAVFVANINAVKTDDGDAFSYCAWTAGIASLLPKTDKLAFVAGLDREPLMVDWRRAAEVVGHLMSAQEMYPERYRVDEFPSEEQLALLAAAD